MLSFPATLRTMSLLSAEDLQQDLTVQTIGQTLEIHEEIDSTNDYLLAAANYPGVHGRVVIAERQTAGRGRLRRSWHSPKGASLMLSTIVRCAPDACEARTILLWSALAVRHAIASVCQIDTRIKWPNDLVVADRKLCGILIESRSVGKDERVFVVGIGLNCLQHASHFPPELSNRATSLDLESDVAIDRGAVARGVIEQLDHWYHLASTHTAEFVRDAWMACALSLGHRLHLQSAGRRYSGRVVELDPQAGILVELEQGGRRLFDPHTTSVVHD